MGERRFLLDRCYVRRYRSTSAIFHPLYGGLYFFPNKVLDELKRVQAKKKSLNYDDIHKLQKLFPRYDWYRDVIDLIYCHILVDTKDHDPKKFCDHQIRRIASQKEVLRTIYLFLTLNCNMNCSYCSVRKPAYLARLKSHTMDRAMIARIMKFLDSYCYIDPSPKSIICFGGEPLLNFDLIKEVARAADLSAHTHRNNWTHYDVSIVTNGLLMTAEKARYLAANDISVGVSIDGLSASATAMRTTKTGYTQQLLKNIELMEQHGILKVFNTTVSKHNISNIPSMLKKLSRISSVRCLALNKMHFSSPENVASYPDVDSFRHEYDGLFDAAETVGYQIADITAMKQSLMNGTICDTICNSNGAMMAIDPDGNVSPCTAMCGVKNQTVLFGDGHRVMKSPLMRTWRRQTMYAVKSCREACDILPVCGGGCAANSYFLLRHIGSPYEQGCKWRRYLFERAVDSIAREVGVR